MNVLIKSATIIDPSSSHHRKVCDLLITNGTIEKIASNLPNPDNRKEIHLDNLHISQGWMDSHVSFGEPGLEERETLTNGLNVAAKSGFTAVVLNANTQPVLDSKADIQFVLSKAAKHAVRLLPTGALTKNGNGTDLAELYDMHQAGAVGFYDHHQAVENPNLLKIALQYTQVFEGLVIAFCQDGQLAGKGVANEETSATKLGLKGIPALAETLQVNRNLFLLEYAGGKLHLPVVSSKESVALIREAKKKGLDISCSVSINNLVLTDNSLSSFDTNKKLLPPLRTAEDVAALLEGLQDGTIDAVTSDHNPIDIENKKMEFDHALFGSIGLESCFGALQTVCDTETAIGFLTGLKSRFGIAETPIEAGSVANLTLFNPDIKWILEKEHLLSTSKNAALLHQKLRGKPYGIYANKKLVL